MSVFYFLYIILVFSSILFNRSRGVCLILVMLMAFVCTFRGINVGSDTINYYLNNFDISFSLLESSRNLEFGFQFISELITQMDINPRWCLYIFSLITYIYLFLAALRFNKLMGANMVIFVLLYFVMGYYGMAFNIARQMAALSILLYGYSFLIQEDRNKYWFFFYVFLASSLHISSLLYVCLYFARYIELRKINFRMIVIISLLLLVITQVFKGPLLSFVMSRFEVFALYSKYLQQTEESTISIVGFAFKFIQLLMSLYIYKQLRTCCNHYFLNLFLVSIFINLFLGAFYGNIYRINLGFVVFHLIAYATYLSTFDYNFSIMPKSGMRISIETIFFIILVVIYGYETLSGLSRGAYDVVPYYITF